MAWGLGVTLVTENVAVAPSSVTSRPVNVPRVPCAVVADHRVLGAALRVATRERRRAMRNTRKDRDDEVAMAHDGYDAANRSSVPSAAEAGVGPRARALRYGDRPRRRNAARSSRSRSRGPRRDRRRQASRRHRRGRRQFGRFAAPKERPSMKPYPKHESVINPPRPCHTPARRSRPRPSRAAARGCRRPHRCTTRRAGPATARRRSPFDDGSSAAA